MRQRLNTLTTSRACCVRICSAAPIMTGPLMHTKAAHSNTHQQLNSGVGVLDLGGNNCSHNSLAMLYHTTSYAMALRLCWECTCDFSSSTAHGALLHDVNKLLIFIHVTLLPHSCYTVATALPAALRIGRTTAAVVLPKPLNSQLSRCCPFKVWEEQHDADVAGSADRSADVDSETAVMQLFPFLDTPVMQAGGWPSRL
jgi:hypothetical protein